MFDLGDKPFESPIVEVDKGWTASTVPYRHIANGVVYPPPMAPSEDAFHFQRLEGSNGAGVVGWQMKFFDSTPFQMSTLSAEVPKFMTSISEVLVIACTNYGPHLLNVLNGADDNVVVLKAWSNDTAAVYSMDSRGNKLLWRSDVGESRWCVFPSQKATHRTPKGNWVTVRPGLEVVLPHPDVVAELVGRDLMKALRSASVERADLVIGRLDDILDGKRDAAAGAAAEPIAVAGPAPPASKTISVRLKDGAAKPVGFSKASSADAIETAIRRCLNLRKGVEFQLRNSADVPFAVDGALEAGEYTVELIDTTQ